MASRFLSLYWLTGPIFEKELRVSSRRRRNYVLRFAYLALLTAFLALFWIEEVPSGGSGVYSVSRMAVAGQGIVAFIVWFQFCMIQVVAGVMLSTSISDEIYHQTLGLLMTTPVSSFQIVMGKLCSKLLQLLLLLAISLPLLGIVRIFGGVPWGYVVSSLCITLTATVFVGSLSLFVSIFSRRAYVVIIITALTMAILFALIPALAAALCRVLTGQWPGPAFTKVIFYPNPYVAMFSNTMTSLNVRVPPTLPVPMWMGHCLIMLAASAILLVWSMVVVRRVALRQATGQLGIARGRRGSRKAIDQASATGLPVTADYRRVKGRPVVWKELKSPLFGRRRTIGIVVVLVGLVVLGLTYAFFGDERALDDNEVHILYAVCFTLLGMLFTTVIPATCITSEKESRSWPLLVATTLTDWQILWGKFVGTLRRCLPVWFLLLGHFAIFPLFGLAHPVGAVQMAILVAWLVVFLSGTGLYFSARFKHTTTAVIANFALAVAVWGLLPLFLGLIEEISHSQGDYVEACFDTNPIYHAVVIAGAVAGRRLKSYDWAGLRNSNAAEATVWMLFCMVVYMILGFLFAWRAKCRFRRSLF